MIRRGTRSRWAAAAIATVGLLLAPGATVGALVGFDRRGQTDGSNNVTVTQSKRSITTTQRVDLEDAPPAECGVPASDATLVDETSTEPTVIDAEVRLTIGPATILIGDLDAGGTPREVLAGQQNVDTLLTYETVVTQYFQATAAGEACAVVASAARFTG